MSQSVAALQVKFSNASTPCWDFSKLHSGLRTGAVTWQLIHECGVKVVLQMHAAELEESLSQAEEANREDFWL